MPQIRKLDPALVNKIAAGEVIERPASVVKELVENAIDAGASRIEVGLEEGGSTLIRVSDDGGGIAPDELPLSVAPHATSKIETADDLFHIASLGFRGEALASIASVSQMRICSRTPERLEANELFCEDGVTQGPRACAAAPGTTIEVRNLFYNVPARRKFMRRAATEMSHVTEQIARLSLAHPQIAFGITHNGRKMRTLPATDERRTRIADFYGRELAECLYDIDRDERGLRIEALIAPPAQSRPSSKWQYLFLNGRYIVDRRIGYAVREAFRGLMEHDRYPVVFIFLSADPASFDVNVHPTKIEVRWKDAGLVQSQVLAVLRETLLSHDITPMLRTRQESAAAPPSAGEVTLQERTRAALADYLREVDPTQARIRFRPPPFPTNRMRDSIASTFSVPRPEASPPDMPPGDFCRPTAVTPDSQDNSNESADGARSQSSDSPAHSPSTADAFLEEVMASNSVLQIHNAYLVAQTDEGIIIVDQHALHERILYEKFRQRILEGPLESQRLLIPQTVEASAHQVQAVEQHAALLQRLGIELSIFGPNAVAVQSFPTLLPDVDVVAFTSDLLDRLAEGDGAESEETLIHSSLDMMACKAAVKAGDPLTADEMRALLAQRHLVEKSSNCPHGRPTTLQLSTRDLERQFKRS